MSDIVQTESIQPQPAKFNPKGYAKRVFKKFTTKEGIIGSYSYAALFTPEIPFMKKKDVYQPFFPLHGDMPLLLGAILGLQHSLAMLAGVITPPLIISSTAKFDTEMTQYLVSSSLIVSGLLSLVQMTRIKVPYTKYYIGTGLISVVGTSFATITIITGAIPQMYKNGKCPTDADGNSLACPDGYGAILGTSAICSLLEIAMSFIPAKVLQRVFPPLVTGPVVLLIGAHLIETGLKNWGGGSNCFGKSETTGYYSVCPNVGAPKAAIWGSAQYIGLGFSVFVTIVFCERFGAPIMKSCAVIIGLLVGCIIAAACGYFSHSGIDAAPAVSFIWVHTFKLTIYGPVVLPMLAVYVVCAMEAIGDITATCDVSRLPVEGEEYDSRIQGGLLADGLNGCIASLMTITPVTTFAQNNGVISITKCANKKVGYWNCFFLIVMGIFSKFAAALVSIPYPVLGGMTTFLFTSVAVSGISIIATLNPITRRDRFILTCSLLYGFGSTLIPTWFSYFFTYEGDNNGLKGFLDAIVLVMETGFAIAGFLGLIMNLIIPGEKGEGEVVESEMDVVSSNEGYSKGMEVEEHQQSYK
ncbi:uncharacterized protein SAPINGB_P001135 [Magnusiomyces paraingens]|uniref:Uric acid-xanthine permease n=1 Tax=Magnusiomyces paraingens TaxID=2606893 RepID=A0A5E8B458_9ASCO|nr:uncharacterized protein SAPINGB_P001135 [Saprochaete ingens]VVT46280.1 unnamed protein product [Saprochaete ingens]